MLLLAQPASHGATIHNDTHIIVLFLSLAVPSQISKDRSLDFDPTCVSYFPTGEFAIITGSSKKVCMHRSTCTYISCTRSTINTLNILVHLHVLDGACACAYDVLLLTHVHVHVHTLYVLPYTHVQLYMNRGQHFVLIIFYQANVYSKEGVCLGSVAEQESWVWTCRPRPGPNSNQVVQYIIGTSLFCLFIHLYIYMHIYMYIYVCIHNIMLC